MLRIVDKPEGNVDWHPRNYCLQLGCGHSDPATAALVQATLPAAPKKDSTARIIRYRRIETLLAFWKDSYTKTGLLATINCTSTQCLNPI